MRPFLQRHAGALYVVGGLAMLAGTALFLHAASVAGSIAGAVLASLGIATMGVTADETGA